MKVGDFRKLDILENLFGGEHRIRRILTVIRNSDSSFPNGKQTIDLWDAAQLIYILSVTDDLPSLKETLKNTNLLGTVTGNYQFEELEKISIGQFISLMLIDPKDLNRLEISLIDKSAYAYFSDRQVKFDRNRHKFLDELVERDRGESVDSNLVREAEKSLSEVLLRVTMADKRVVLKRKFFEVLGEKLRKGLKVVKVSEAGEGQKGFGEEWKLYMLDK